MKKPHGIHPRKPYLSIRITEREAKALLELLEGVDRQGFKACGQIEVVHCYDSIAYRVARARRSA
jgi:hypothetical protein